MTHLDLSFSNELKELHAPAINLYKQPHRKYHTEEHIELLFEGLNKMRPWLESNRCAYSQHEIDLIKLCIIYHDAVYNIGSNTNEADSLNLLLDSGHVTAHEDIDIVTEAILATSISEKHSVSVASSPLTARIVSVLTDLDLYAFALDGGRYIYFADQVLEELGGAKELTFDFYIGNVNFLTMYLNKPKLFNTDFARTNWEKPARINMLNRIAYMSLRLVAAGAYLDDDSCLFPAYKH